MRKILPLMVAVALSLAGILVYAENRSAGSVSFAENKETTAGVGLTAMNVDMNWYLTLGSLDIYSNCNTLNAFIMNNYNEADNTYGLRVKLAQQVPDSNYVSAEDTQPSSIGAMCCYFNK